MPCLSYTDVTKKKKKAKEDEPPQATNISSDRRAPDGARGSHAAGGAAVLQPHREQTNGAA